VNFDEGIRKTIDYFKQHIELVEGTTNETNDFN
jgi:hypothetical protein